MFCPKSTIYPQKIQKSVGFGHEEAKLYRGGNAFDTSVNERFSVKHANFQPLKYSYMKISKALIGKREFSSRLSSPHTTHTRHKVERLTLTCLIFQARC